MHIFVLKRREMAQPVPTKVFYSQPCAWHLVLKTAHLFYPTFVLLAQIHLQNELCMPTVNMWPCMTSTIVVLANSLVNTVALIQHLWELNLLPSMQLLHRYLSFTHWLLWPVCSSLKLRVWVIPEACIGPLSIQTYDSVIKVHGMVLASSPGHFLLAPTWPWSEVNMI